MEDGTLIKTKKGGGRFVESVVLILSSPQSFLIMLLLKAGAKPTESSLWCHPLSGTHPEPAAVYGGGFDHRIPGWKRSQGSSGLALLGKSTV